MNDGIRLIFCAVIVLALALLFFSPTKKTQPKTAPTTAHWISAHDIEIVDGKYCAVFDIDSVTNISARISYRVHNKIVFDTVCYSVCKNKVVVEVPDTEDVVAITIYYQEDVN
jgi:hypothetical protein